MFCGLPCKVAWSLPDAAVSAYCSSSVCSVGTSSLLATPRLDTVVVIPNARKRWAFFMRQKIMHTRENAESGHVSTDQDLPMLIQNAAFSV